MIAPFLRFLLVLTLVDAHSNFTGSIDANWTKVADGPSARRGHAMGTSACSAKRSSGGRLRAHVSGPTITERKSRLMKSKFSARSLKFSGL